MDQPQLASNRWQDWVFAATASSAACSAWFAYLNRGGCWLFRRGDFAWIIFALPWLWLVLLLGFKTRGRLVLLGITVLLVIFGVVALPNVESWGESVQESSAVGRLRTYHDSLETFRSQHGSYPEKLPDIPSNYRRVERFYTFVYLPSLTSKGEVSSYLIQATSRRPECYCEDSFIIEANGLIHRTKDSRPASVSDPEIH
jgi:hypothetical protein